MAVETLLPFNDILDAFKSLKGHVRFRATTPACKGFSGMGFYLHLLSARLTYPFLSSSDDILHFFKSLKGDVCFGTAVLTGIGLFCNHVFPLFIEISFGQYLDYFPAESGKI